MSNTQNLMINKNDIWAIIEEYFKNNHLNRLVRHQLESYNDFVTKQIPRTIEMFNPVHIKSDKSFDIDSKKYSLEIFITFTDFKLQRPRINENTGAIKLMYPYEARLRNFTYSSIMTVNLNIKYIVRGGNDLNAEQTFHTVLPNIHIGKLPIMIKSKICTLSQPSNKSLEELGECKLDPGGYFIINGSEKTCLVQERAAENIVQCFNTNKNNNRWKWTAEIKSVPDTKCISPKQISLVITKKNNGIGMPIYLIIPRIKNPIPLFIIFRVFGIISDKKICDYIVNSVNHDCTKNGTKFLYDKLQASIIDANNILTQQDADNYIINNANYIFMSNTCDNINDKYKYFIKDLIKSDLFPHCDTLDKKVHMLAYMTGRLLRTSLGWDKTSDRDSYLNKRLDLTGVLLNNLFRNYFNKMIKDTQKQVIREINNGSWKSTEDYQSIINFTNI